MACDFCGIERDKDALLTKDSSPSAVCVECLNAIIAKRDYTHIIDSCGLCFDQSLPGFESRGFSVCSVCVLMGRLDMSRRATRHVDTESLTKKRTEINELFSLYGDLRVRIAGSADSADTIEDADVEIFVNLDENQDDFDVVVYIRNASALVRHPFGTGPIEIRDTLGVCFELIAQLNILLNCYADLVAGLRRYPISQAKLHLHE